MIKKIILFSFVIVFLNNCGYTPIYSKKNLNFEIETLTTTGEAKVNKILLNKLNIYSDIPNAQRALKLLINSKTTKSTITKDKKGNPTQFSKNLLVTMKITDDKNNTMATKFSESSTYDNSATYDRTATRNRSMSLSQIWPLCRGGNGVVRE